MALIFRMKRTFRLLPERVALFDTIAALLATLVIIPVMATTGAQLDQGGPGLMFIYLPESDQRNAWGMADRDDLLRRSIACRYVLADQSVRSSDRKRFRKSLENWKIIRHVHLRGSE